VPGLIVYALEAALGLQQNGLVYLILFNLPDEGPAMQGMESPMRLIRKMSFR
jgi:hypothetical protein